MRLADLLSEAHHKLGLKLGFRLWDGTRAPDGWATDALYHRHRRRGGVVSSLVRRPRVDTLIKLHVDGRLALENGSIFDLAASRPQGKIGRLARGISKAKALRVARLFFFVDRGPRSVLDPVRGDELARDGRPETNRANVAYHYDVSNDFYRLFLDEEMVYTCAYFTEDHGDIARAQRDKLDMICRKLRLKPGERFLDIGCGWGALVCHAARHYGVEAHGVTLAREQLALAQEKVERLGIADRVTFHFKDYVEMDGTFDKIASIGMFEQVGIANHPTYFATVNRLLRPQGLYLHHTIARRAKKTDRRFPADDVRVPRAGALHLPRRRARSSRHVDRQPGARRLRGPRRRGLARALPAHDAPVVGAARGAPRRGGGAGRAGEDADVVALPRRLLDGLRPRRGAYINPDAGLQAHPRPHSGLPLSPGGPVSLRFTPPTQRGVHEAHGPRMLL